MIIYPYSHHHHPHQNLLEGDFFAGDPERDLAKSTFLIDRDNSSSFLFLMKSNLSFLLRVLLTSSS